MGRSVASVGIPSAGMSIQLWVTPPNYVRSPVNCDTRAVSEIPAA